MEKQYHVNDTFLEKEYDATFEEIQNEARRLNKLMLEESEDPNDIQNYQNINLNDESEVLNVLEAANVFVTPITTQVI